MRQPLDHTRNGILGTAVFSRHLVAHIHDIFPVLGCEILVGRLGYERQKSVAGWSGRQAILSSQNCKFDLPTTSSKAFC
jgi:hypothetical protein